MLAMAWQRVSAARTPAVETWCGDPALAEMHHVRLHDCEISPTVYSAGSDVWIGLHRPTATAPSVIVHFHGMDDAAIYQLLTTELAAGTLDVARTHADARSVSELRSHSEFAHAVFVGDWRADRGAEIDDRSGVLMFLAAGLVLLDIGRIVAWFVRRLLGR